MLTPRSLLLGLGAMLAVCACTHTPSPRRPDESFYTLPPPPPRYSAAEIGAIFDRPINVTQLLRNLKIAVDRDLLAQPEFATDENLLKFFNGSQVSRKAIEDFPGVQKFARQDIVVSVANEYFPQMSVEMQQGLFKHGGYDGPSGHVPVTVRHFGYLHVDVSAVPDITAGDVRSVFGKESVAQVGGDDWASEGHAGFHTSKGILHYVYTDPATEEFLLRIAPNEHKNVRFVIALPKPGLQGVGPHGLERRLAIYDADEIAGIFIDTPEP